MPADIEQQRCKAALPEEFKLRGDEHLSPVRDSWGDMGYGLYKVAKLFRRHFRPIQIRGVNESIDESARMKWSTDPLYRPYNLAHAGRADLQEETGLLAYRDLPDPVELRRKRAMLLTLAEVAIGLALVYFLVSTLCSGLIELVAHKVGVRAAGSSASG